MLQRVLRRFKEFLYPPPVRPTTALVLSGGGARSAYQAGVLRYVAEAFPGMYFPVMTGVSAGAINTAHLANHTGTFVEATTHLEESWRRLGLDRVVEVESGLSILWGLLWRGSGSGEHDRPLTTADVRRTHGLLDTTPLWHYLREQLNAPNGVLTGVQENLRDDRLQAVAVITTNYATGQTVTWVQGDDFDVWERPDRVSVHATLTVDHVMASTALPLVFPSVRIGDAWYGDGGIRLSAPLAPAVHLGADRILVVSNLYQRSRAEADEPAVRGYPPTAQIIGMLMNSIATDALDQDAITLERVNKLVRELPPRKRNGLRPVDLLQIHPSVDLGRLAHDYQDALPSSLRFLTTGLGTAETRSSDWLSVLLFAPEYVDRLLDIGYHDAKAQHERIGRFLSGAYDAGAGVRSQPGERRTAPVESNGVSEDAAALSSTSSDEVDAGDAAESTDAVDPTGNAA